MRKFIRLILENIELLRPLVGVVRILDRRRRLWLGLTICLMISSSLLEMAAIAWAGLFVGVLGDREFLNGLRVVRQAESLSGLELAAPLAGLSHFTLLSAAGLLFLLFYLGRIVGRAWTEWNVFSLGATVDMLFGRVILGRILGLDYQTVKLNFETGKIFAYAGWRAYYGSSYIQPVLNMLNNLILFLILVAALMVSWPGVASAVFGFSLILSAVVYRRTKNFHDRAVADYRDRSLAENRSLGEIFNTIRELYQVAIK